MDQPQESAKSPFVKIQEVLPLSIIALTFCGFVRIASYYNNFNISIISYLELTDVVPQIINDVISLVLIIIMIVPLFLIVDNLFKNNKALINHNIIKIYAASIILCFIAYVLFAYLNFNNPDQLIKGVLIFFFTALTPSVFERFKVKPSYQVCLLYVFLLFYSVEAGYSEFRKVEEGYYIGTTLKTDKVAIKSNPVYFFIGHTSKYAFFYKRKDNRVDVYRIDKLEVLNIKTTNNGFFDVVSHQLNIPLLHPASGP